MSVALYGMFLAIIIPAGKKNRTVAGIVAIAMMSSFLFTKIPVLGEISSGMQIIVLTVLISGAAAVFFPVREESEGGEPGEP